MDSIERWVMESDANDLGDDICKIFGKYNVNVVTRLRQVVGNRIIYLIKTKGNTREAHVRANAPEVQRRLKLPLFQVVKHNFTLYLIVSRDQIIYSRLPAVLDTSFYRERQRHMRLPYLVGYNVLGEVVMEDLTELVHLLLGGSTNSGKSVGLQALITSIAYSKSPSQVNFVLIDVGATNLMPFEGLPHLSCPVVRDLASAVRTLAALTTEMERRINLEYADPNVYKFLPKLVVVIDEFPALFTGVDKAMSKSLTNNVSSLLQRGRHAKIHLVLAAQNPTCQNMKIDLGNITTRIAFKCAKRNFSETIIGEGGAENLLGHGDLLLKSTRYDCPQRVQGVYITPSELRQIVQDIKMRHQSVSYNKFNLTLPHNDLTESAGDLGSQLSCTVVKKGPSKADKQLADVILWALAHDSISINMLMRKENIGWNKASRLVSRLEELGIVDKPDGKLPRNVIPNCTKDIPEELLRFMWASGYSKGTVYAAIDSRR